MVRFGISSCLPLGTRPLLRKKAARALGVPVGKLHRCVPVRQSIDARKKGDVHYVMTVDVSLPHEEAVVARGRGIRFLWWSRRCPTHFLR